MSGEEVTYHVGVQNNPDGTKDYSRSLQMFPKEVEKKDEVVDRLLGPLLLDKDRERQYDRFQTEMLQKQEKGELQGWLVGVFNKIKQGNEPNVTLDDVKGVSFVSKSDEVRQLEEDFGVKVNRGFFSMSLSDYAVIYKKVAGVDGVLGCTIHGGPLDNDPLTKHVDITLVPESKVNDSTIHEIAHTLDPHMSTREPQDRLLEEFGTYYRETYVPKYVHLSTVHSDGKGNDSEPIVTTNTVYNTLDRVGRNIKQDVYYREYGPAFKSETEYDEQVDRVSSTIRKLEAHMEKSAINKAIFNAKSLSELDHLLEVVEESKPKK